MFEARPEIRFVLHSHTRAGVAVSALEDGLLPLSDGERFQKEIPGAQLLVLDQCGHVPQVEKAAEFNAAVMKFLAEATPAK